MYFDENFFGSFEGFAKLGQGADKNLHSSFTPVCFWITNIDEFKL